MQLSQILMKLWENVKIKILLCVLGIVLESKKYKLASQPLVVCKYDTLKILMYEWKYFC